jgi:hypothetical protein
MTKAPKSVCVIIPVYQPVGQLEKTVHDLIEASISSPEMRVALTTSWEIDI